MAQTTKRALEASLKKLLNDKPLDKVTVTDITEDCGISRMTFYYHFKDIFDLVEWMFVEETARVIDGKQTSATWEEGFLRIFQTVLDNKAFILNVYYSGCKEQVVQFLYSITHDLLIGVVEEQAAGMQVRDDDKQFIAHFYKFGFVGLLTEWIERSMREEPSVIVDRLATLIKGNFKQALTRYHNHESL